MKVKDTGGFDFDPGLDFDQILTNPILDIAARFWDDERYQAFRICYRSMRLLDDLVDNRKSAAGAISKVEQSRLAAMVRNWIEAVEKGAAAEPFQQQLAKTRARFQIPVWPWQKLAGAMIYDLRHDGFPTFRAFIRYAEGAAVSPGSIFVHLCGVSKQDDVYHPPDFDIREVARPLALFCYIVHIIRDFQKDQNSHLNYFAGNLMAENGLSRRMLEEIAAGGKIPPDFRNLMQKYYNHAEYYRHKARHTIDRYRVYLQPRYQLSMEIIYSLYLQIFERIDVSNGTFTAEELCPSPEEVRDRIDLTISTFKSSTEIERHE
jgi:phytoene synthase